MGLLNKIDLTPPQKLFNEVENRRVFTLNHCELNIYETYKAAEQVKMSFSNIVFTSMVRGKKIIHFPDQPDFEYTTGETLLGPAGTTAIIDFPNARETDPTQCIAFTFDDTAIEKVIHYLNEYFPRVDNEEWHINFRLAHLKNSTALADVMNKMVQVCTEISISKDMLAELTLKELIVRLVQLQNYTELNGEDHLLLEKKRFYAVIDFIRSNLHAKFNIDLLSQKAYMSRSHFFRCFKQEYGISPIQFIIQERLKKAKSLLEQHTLSVQQVSYETGFEDVNNFIRIFKKTVGQTPGSYKSNMH